MRDLIGPFDDSFSKALTLRREASLMRGWAMAWNEEVPLPGTLPTDENQDRTQVLRRQLQSNDCEMATVDAGQVNVQEENVDQQLAAAVLQIDDDSDDESVDGQGFDGLDDNVNNLQDPVGLIAAHVLGNTLAELATANQCSLCQHVGASVAVVGCGCVCICRSCSDEGDLPLKVCPICRNGNKDRNGWLILQRLH
jgi:hypothetical protein